MIFNRLLAFDKTIMTDFISHENLHHICSWKKLNILDKDETVDYSQIKITKNIFKYIFNITGKTYVIVASSIYYNCAASLAAFHILRTLREIHQQKKLTCSAKSLKLPKNFREMLHRFLSWEMTFLFFVLIKFNTRWRKCIRDTNLYFLLFN